MNKCSVKHSATGAAPCPLWQLSLAPRFRVVLSLVPESNARKEKPCRRTENLDMSSAALPSFDADAFVSAKVGPRATLFSSSRTASRKERTAHGATRIPGIPHPAPASSIGWRKQWDRFSVPATNANSRISAVRSLKCVPFNNPGGLGILEKKLEV